MKKILSINSHASYSTGGIIKLLENGMKDDFIFYRATPEESDPKNFLISGKYFSRQLGKVFSQLNGSDGFRYKKETKKLIKWIDEIKPDLIHIHNLHGYYINAEMLLNYINSKHIPVIYTMHDCWTFTGRCAVFDAVKCEKWKSGCGRCPYKKQYPLTRLFDSSKKQWLTKKELLTNHSYHYVTPSKWLKDLAMESFLTNEDIRVINNAIDYDLFANNYEGYKLQEDIDPNKKIILSVAYPFTKQKGLDDFNKLQSLIDKDQYQIVLIGITDEYKTVPGIIRVSPIKDKKLLAYYYSKSYAFMFFTQQDNYPTVLLEASASGLPIISYDVGGCKEIVNDKVTGYIIKKNDVEEAKNHLDLIKDINKENCKKEAQKHKISEFVEQYKSLYKSILK